MSDTASSADSFARVRTALLAVWPSVADPAAGPTKAEVGRLLDECGSDHRPLVDLLLDLGRQVRPVLANLGPQTPGSWVHARAPLVHRLVSTRYLQPDVARWAVDVWGCALGVAPHTAMMSPTLEPTVDDSGAASGSVTPASGPARRATPAAGHKATAAPSRPPVLAPQQVPAAMKQLPSWAGGPVSFRVGQKPKQASLAALAQSGRVVVRGTVPPGPRFQQVERRAVLLLGALLVVISGGLLNAFRHRPDVTTPVDAATTAATTVEMATTGAGTTGAGTTGAATTGAATTGAATTGAATTGAATTGAATTGAGTTGVGALPPGAEMRIRDAGVAGTYVVTQRVRDVSGSESCDAVAQALAGGRETQELVSHAPGAPTFTLVTRGVTGTLDTDGQFVSEPRAGTTNNVNWRFRMRGRFGPDGFVGESITHTDAILRWGKIQTCVVTADLTGRRRLN